MKKIFLISAVLLVFLYGIAKLPIGKYTYKESNIGQVFSFPVSVVTATYYALSDITSLYADSLNNLYVPFGDFTMKLSYISLFTINDIESGLGHTVGNSMASVYYRKDLVASSNLSDFIDTIAIEVYKYIQNLSEKYPIF